MINRGEMDVFASGTYAIYNGVRFAYKSLETLSFWAFLVFGFTQILECLIVVYSNITQNGRI